jgi:NADH-quinone oxidoreductase subunit J
MTAGQLAQVDALAAAANEASSDALLRALVASPLLWACALFALGLWFSLPGGGAGGRKLGIVLVVISLGLGATRLPMLVGWLDRGMFASLASVTVLSCVAAVIAKNPVYCAIWFGLALLGTAGLFLFAGAQFLSVATVTVYAGAILVTFLFVIMLAQPSGHAFYDRVSWEAFLSAAAGAILVGLLTSAIDRGVGAGSQLAAGQPLVAPAEREDSAAHGILAESHVAHLGRELLGRHLIAMQAAGALMLAAIVGAVAIVARRRTPALDSAALGFATGQRFRPPDDGEVILPGEHVRFPRRESAGGVHA